MHELNVGFHLERENNTRREVMKQRREEVEWKEKQEQIEEERSWGLRSRCSLMKSIFGLLDNWGADKQTTRMPKLLVQSSQIDFLGRCARVYSVQHGQREIC